MTELAFFRFVCILCHVKIVACEPPFVPTGGEKRLRSLITSTPEWRSEEARAAAVEEARAEFGEYAPETLVTALATKHGAHLRKGSMLFLCRLWGYRSNLWQPLTPGRARRGRAGLPDITSPSAAPAAAPAARDAAAPHGLPSDCDSSALQGGSLADDPAAVRSARSQPEPRQASSGPEAAPEDWECGSFQWDSQAMASQPPSEACSRRASMALSLPVPPGCLLSAAFRPGRGSVPGGAAIRPGQALWPAASVWQAAAPLGGRRWRPIARS